MIRLCRDVKDYRGVTKIGLAVRHATAKSGVRNRGHPRLFGETGDTHVSLSMTRTKSRCPPTPAPHTPQLEKGMCTVRISAEALALRRNLITTMGVPQWRRRVHRLDRPFRALNFVGTCSQGVALGWHGLPLWGGRLQFQ